MGLQHDDISLETVSEPVFLSSQHQDNTSCSSLAVDQPVVQRYRELHQQERRRPPYRQVRPEMLQQLPVFNAAVPQSTCYVLVVFSHAH